MRRNDGESYLLIDHSESPGFSGAQCASVGIPVHAHEIFAKGTKFEAGTKSCSHCQRQIVLRPERIRTRTTCPKCDKYICDNCAVNFKLTLECVPFKKRIEDYLRKTALAQINAKL